MCHDTVLIATLVVFSCGLSGCGASGEKPQPVSGKVTFQGKPVAAGVIRFSNPEAGIDMTAKLDAEGAYEVIMARGAGLPKGTYRVAIMPPRVNIPMGEGPLPPPRAYPDIPVQYRNPSTSGLTLVVKPGKNLLNVDMRP